MNGSPQPQIADDHTPCRERRSVLLALPILLAAAGSKMVSSAEAAAGATAVRSIAEYQRALEDAARSHRAALVDIGADWCAVCKTIDRKILRDRRVAELMTQIGFIRIDVTAMDQANRQLLNHLRADGPPTLFIVDTATGQEYSGTRSVGIFPTRNLIARLKPFAH